MTKGCLIVVSGPSGAGKGTVCGEFLRTHRDVTYSISATTRAPRAGETDGVEYFFVKKSEFKKMIEGGKLLEWAEVFGNYYGTPIDPIREKLDAGRDVLLEIDTRGALSVMRKCPDGIYIFLLPPSLSELERRLRQRANNTDEDIKRRLSEAAGEISRAREYAYAVVNDNVEEAARRFSSIVEAERCRTSRCQRMIDDITRPH